MKIYNNLPTMSIYKPFAVNNAAAMKNESSKQINEDMKNSEKNLIAARSQNNGDTGYAALSISKGAADRQRLLAGTAKSTINETAVGSSANQAVSDLNRVTEAINTAKANAANYTNRLENTAGKTDIGLEYSQRSDSKVKDMDMRNQLNITKSFMLNDPKSAMLAQSNQLSNDVLNLLK